MTQRYIFSTEEKTIEKKEEKKRKKKTARNNLISFLNKRSLRNHFE